MEWKPPFTLFSAGTAKDRDSSYRTIPLTDPHAHRRILLQRCTGGTCTLTWQGKQSKLKVNDLIVVDRHTPCVFGCEDDDLPYSYEWISIGYETNAPLASCLNEYPIIHLQPSCEFDVLFTQALHRRTTKPYRETPQDSILAYTIYLACNEVHLTKISPRNSPAELLKRELEERLSEPLQIKKLARDLKYSHEALIRLFKEEYGITPLKFLKGLRVAKACELIREGHLSFKQISLNCGFSSHNYFSRSFLQKMGMSPKEYRSLSQRPRRNSL